MKRMDRAADWTAGRWVGALGIQGAWLWLGLGLSLGWAAEINPPLGPYIHLRPEHFADTPSFRETDRLVVTPYFYWYDASTGAHLVNADGSDALTDHPVTLEGFTYRSVAWHEQELRDMIEAGIDIVLPVYWGEPSQRIPGKPISAQPWSYAGIPPLVAAREALLKAGLKPPGIGLFYDTSTLQYNVAGQRIDLTTDSGRQWFYETVRDFFSLVPPRHWALIDGRPVIFLYSAAFARAHDQRCVEALQTAFAADFAGKRSYLVREVSWQVQTDQVYAWGGALGLRNPGVASLGPGYDHSAVPGREPLIVPREGGAFFERNWRRFLSRPSSMVMIETWNEFHEGTEIAASREYGRQYLALNRYYADFFKRGLPLPRPRGPHSDVSRITVALQETNGSRGLIQFDHADGVTTVAQAGGSACREAVTTAYGGRYFYFRIDDSFKWAERMQVEAEVEYWDGGQGSFGVEYDGSDLGAPFQGAYTAARTHVRLGGRAEWRTAPIRLADARFLNSQNGGADFRLTVRAEPFRVRRVSVVRLGLPVEAGEAVPGSTAEPTAPLDEAWATTGDAARFAMTNGIWALESRGLGPAWFRWLPGGESSEQEVLARMRVVSTARAKGMIGGVAVGCDATGATGMLLGFHLQDGVTPGVVLWDPRLGIGAEAAQAWATNRWYWLRLQQAPNTLTHYPDVRGRIWSADGETAEPTEWHVWWDYHPRDPVRRGAAGLGVGGGSEAWLECDFLLVKAATLGETRVRLPGRVPARAWLRMPAGTAAGGMTIRFTGEPLFPYLLESAPDLRNWSQRRLQTDAAGQGVFEDVADPGPGLGGRFYRLQEGIADLPALVNPEGD